MVVKFGIDLFFGLLSGIFSVLPDITWSLDTTAFQAFIGTLNVAMYLLPMRTVVMMVSIIIWITVFRIVVSLIKTLWDLLPLV